MFSFRFLLKISRNCTKQRKPGHLSKDTPPSATGFGFRFSDATLDSTCWRDFVAGALASLLCCESRKSSQKRRGGREGSGPGLVLLSSVLVLPLASFSCRTVSWGILFACRVAFWLLHIGPSPSSLPWNMRRRSFQQRCKRAVASWPGFNGLASQPCWLLSDGWLLVFRCSANKANLSNPLHQPLCLVCATLGGHQLVTRERPPVSPTSWLTSSACPPGFDKIVAVTPPLTNAKRVYASPRHLRRPPAWFLMQDIVKGRSFARRGRNAEAEAQGTNFPSSLLKDTDRHTISKGQVPQHCMTQQPFMSQPESNLPKHRQPFVACASKSYQRPPSRARKPLFVFPP